MSYVHNYRYVLERQFWKINPDQLLLLFSGSDTKQLTLSEIRTYMLPDSVYNYVITKNQQVVNLVILWLRLE